MNRNPYSIAFITVNYNGIADTRELLISIRAAQLTMDYAVVVIDNGSRENEWDLLKAEFPEIRGLYSTLNLGFAGANNLGIKQVEAAYYYFINNDTLLPATADSELRKMLDFMRANPHIGGLSPKIMYVDTRDLIQYAGSTELSAITLRNVQIGYQEYDKGQYQEVKATPYLHGAAMLIPAAVVDEIGPMPDFYFLYYEELDWCESIRLKYQLYYYPEAYILHKESASTGVDSPFKTYYLVRNRFMFAYRHRRGIVRILSVLYLLGANTAHAVKDIVQGSADRSKARLRGIRDGLKWIMSNKKIA